MEFTTLNNGLKMPMEGFGVYQVTNQLECEASVYNAILAGCRLIDTAVVYGNEEAVGNAIKKAIGVCNCYPHVLADICETVEIIPAVNQIELHPFYQQSLALKVANEYGVVCEAWGPFAEGGHGVVVIPKSVHRERIEQNMDIWDFKLDDEEMLRIAELDTGKSDINNHFDPEYVKRIHSVKAHE